MSNLSSFVGPSTITTATVTSCNASFFLNGLLLCSAANVPGLGEYCEGGHIICKLSSSSVAWIVSPRCAEVSRTWYCREDANTLAQSCTSRTGWFVPTISQLDNPGYICRTYWDLNSRDSYWSSTESGSNAACRVTFSTFYNTGISANTCKNTLLCVRSFRCVTY